MSRVYISSWSKPLALAAKSALEAAGHKVVSTWHDGEFAPTVMRKESEMVQVADQDIDTLSQTADALLLLVPEDLAPGGIYVEAGVAIGVGIPVLAVGLRRDFTRGNAMLYHSDVDQYDTIDQAVADVRNVIEENDGDIEDDYDDQDSEWLDPEEDEDEEDESEDDDDLTVDECGSVITTDDVLATMMALPELGGYDYGNLRLED